MSRIFRFVVRMLPAVFAAGVPMSVEAKGGPHITGVWSCEVTRPGSTASRPLTYVFHADGIFGYSSQTTVNGGALALPFTSRGGGLGEWRRIGHDEFAYRAKENLLIDGNAGGFFHVDSTQHLDRRTGRLCSGRPECPGTETKIRLTRFTFAPDGSITGEIDLLPADSKAETICDRLTSVFDGLP